MAKQGIVIICLICGAMAFGYSSTPAASTSTSSKFVGKTISVGWGGFFDLAPSPFFHVRDADAATGMLCLSPITDEKFTFWVHPSKFVFCTVATEKELKDFAEQQKEEAKQTETHEHKINE